MPAAVDVRARVRDAPLHDLRVDRRDDRVVVAGDDQRGLPDQPQHRQRAPAEPGQQLVVVAAVRAVPGAGAQHLGGALRVGAHGAAVELGGDPGGVAGVPVPARGEHPGQHLRPARHHDQPGAGADQHQPPALLGLGHRELLGEAAAPGEAQHVDPLVAQLPHQAGRPAGPASSCGTARPAAASRRCPARRTGSPRGRAAAASTNGCSTSMVAPMPFISSSGVRAGPDPRARRTATRSCRPRTRSSKTSSAASTPSIIAGSALAVDHPVLTSPPSMSPPQDEWPDRRPATRGTRPRGPAGRAAGHPVGARAWPRARSFSERRSPGVGAGGPDDLQRVVEVRPQHDRQPEQEAEQQEGDRRGQRAVGVAAAGEHGDVHPQPGGGRDEHEHRQHRPGQQPAPGQAVRQRHLVQRGEHGDQQQPDPG